MAGIIKNTNKLSDGYISKINLKDFQRAIFLGEKVSSITVCYRTFNIELSTEEFIGCLCGDSKECSVIYDSTELPCLYCNMGITDWIRNAMKKPITSYVRDLVKYNFNLKEVTLFNYDTKFKWILAQPVINGKQEMCVHCNGTALHDVTKLNTKKGMKNLKLDKDLILEELRRV